MQIEGGPPGMVPKMLRHITLGAVSWWLFASPLSAHDAERMAELTAPFDGDALLAGPEIVACTLSGGTLTSCFGITVGIQPVDRKPGPWCPRNIADGPDKAGIWLDKGTVYDADGAFVEHLASFYGDPVWQLYDPKTGAVRVTDTKAGCLAAAKPDVEPEYQNYCVECNPDDFKGIELSYVIPLSPVPVARPKPLRPPIGAGVAFDGIKFNEPRPVADILAAHTIAPFDNCGGHVNPHVGYHYHAALGCGGEVATPGHAPKIGIAMDGYDMYARARARTVRHRKTSMPAAAMRARRWATAIM